MLKFLYLVLLIHVVLSSDVLEFKDSNFDSQIAEHSTILVEFFAPWCGHCKKLAPEFEIAATKLKTNDPPIPIAKVDCTAETKVCQDQGVSGYPTLKVFKNGKFAFDYAGERNADGIVKYMISKSGPSSKLLSSVSEADKFLLNEDPVIIGSFSHKDSALEATFKKVADKLNEDFRFAYTNDDSVKSYVSLESGIGIFYPKKMHNKFEENIKKYSGSDSEPSLKSWIEENIMGLAGHKTASNSKYFDKKPLVIAYYNVDYVKNPKGSNYWRNRIMKVAKKIVDSGKQVFFAVSSSKDMAYELNEFGIETPDETKLYIAAKNEKGQKFKMSEDFSMDNLEKFVNALLYNKLSPYLKSEEVPSSNIEPVKVIVAKSFDEIVNDPTKDVLIEFYAPWCGHCKSLAPKYDELATKLSAEKDIVIAKMDATANDVPASYEVTGFPTLYFVPKNGKLSPKPYNGGREVDDFIKFLSAESTAPLSTYDRQGRVKKSDL